MANKKLSLRSFFKSEEQEEAEVKAEMRETYSYEDLINLVYLYAKEDAARSDLDATPRIRITPERTSDVNLQHHWRGWKGQKEG